MSSPTIIGEIVIPSVPAPKERRHRPRHLCDAPAEATALRPEFLFRGTIRNISEGGCYFETPARLHLELSTEIELRIEVGDRRYSTPARVRNAVPGRGMGLEFAFANAKAVEFIKSLIRMLDTAKLAKSI
ncbi:MAG: PilZ domain-containing protein [Terracidiphilus sp.]|jgi:hypothetical protein